MNSPIVRAVIAGLVIFLFSLPVFSQTQTAVKSVKPLGSVSGKVTIKGKGAPGVAIGLRATDSFNPYEMRQLAVTDQDGNYKISNVGSGSYEVTFGAVGYVAADINSRSRSVVMGESENIESVNFAIVRGGVITGKITDADGRPVIQQSVRLFRADNPDSRPPQAKTQPRPLSPAGTFMTDDRGIYRMFGLLPGRYKVAAGRGENTIGGRNVIQLGRASYKEVFYADTTDPENASVIQVSEGSETTNIDIALGRPVETYSVSGRVVDSEGQPIANVRFSLQRLIGERMEFIPQFLSSNGLGEFTAEGLIPGKYGVVLTPETNSELRAESTSFDVVDSNVNGITIRMVKGATISGTVVLETENKLALAKLTQLQVQGYVQNPNAPALGSSARASIAGDGSFRLSGLGPGTASISVGPANGFDQMKGFVLSRIERDGVVQSHGIEVKEGEQMTGIRLIVNYGNATLRGFVTIENGPLPEGARLFVRLLKMGEVPNILPPNVDQRGRFIVDGLPPGSYEVSVSVSGGGLKPRTPVKREIVLQDGVASDVNITLDLAAGPQP
jgi:hypothetical protein